MKNCEKCGKEIDGKYGSGRFCSIGCANTRSFSIETKEKISNHLKGKKLKRTKVECSKCNNLISRSNYSRHFEKCSKGKKLKLDEKWLQNNGKYKCPNCGKEFSKNGICSHIIFSHNKPIQKSNFIDYLDKIRKGEIEAWNKGLTKDIDERIKRNSESVKQSMDEKVKNGWIPGFVKYIKSDDGKLEQSERKKKLYKDFPEKHPNRKLANNRNKMSYPERIAYDWLKDNKINFEPQKNIDRFYVDFLVNNSLVIEIDGEKWHDEIYDNIRDEIISNLGYKIIRIKSKENIVEKLKEIFK